ncbi:MAG: hypothetical protein KJN84_17815 [Bacteroidia bacterium]|nr:hypothetical protein [Bacteroidia bacterium]
MRKFLLSFLLFSMFLNLNASNTAIVLDEQNPTLFIDFDDCVSWFNGYNEDYSEFTAISTPVENCGSLELAGPGYVYRNNTKENTHSCTPGIDSTSLGMCISGLDNCDYIAGDSTSLNFEVRIIPGANGMGSLEEISFYEQAPERFNFHEGASGTNNYPTKFGIRVLIDAVEIYREEDIATARTWDLKTFIFSDVEAFTVTETTVFRVEILPYCLIGNNAVIKAWDIDNLTIKAGCNAVNAGFVKVIGNVNICENDTLETALTFEAENAFGANLQWVLTDNDGLILYLPDSNVVDFDTLPNGIYSIYHLAYGDELTGLEVGSSVNDLAGCFDLSNRVVNVNNKLEPGTLTIGDDLTEVTVCPEDLSSNLVDLSLNDAVGTFTTVLVLNDVMEIVLVEPSSEVDMSSFPLGIYTMVAISHNGQLINAIEGNTLSDISGCIAISNSVTFEKLEFYAGELNLNNNLFCIGDGNPDLLDVEVSNASGVFSQFVITTSDSIVISSASVLPIDLDSAPPGTCLIWNLVSLDSLEINIGESISNISSTCFDISEPAAFERVLNTAGTISLIDGSSTISICVSDSIQDELIFTNDGNASFYSYIITDTTNLILAILNSDTIDFSSAPAGICRIWGVAHDGNLDLNAGDILVDTVSIGSCIDITPNFVEVIRAIDGIVCGEVPCEVDGGFIDLFGSSFCVGDGEPDLVEGDVQGANGPVMQIIVTDGDSNIVALPPGLGFDVDGAGPGMCIVWNAASLDSLDLMVGMHISNIDSDCFDLSQGASFNRTENFGGTVTLDSGETAIEICVGDTLSDALSFITTGVGVNYDFIVTDTFNVILALPDSTVFDFENAPPGICRVWGLAHNSTFNGIVGDTLVEPASIGACFDLSSNFIEVIRLENGVDCGEIPCIVDGGFIDLFDNSFCVGDGVPDLVTGDIQGITGPIRQILVTSDDSIIIALPPSLGFDVDGSEPGTCLVWNVVSTEPINLTIGTHIDSIDLNCFDISEPASFTRIENNAGTIALTSGDTLTTICVGDTIPDVLTFMNMGGSPNSYQYVITDTLNAILALPLGNSFDFNDLSAGTCFVYGVSFTGSFILNVGDTLTNAPSTNDCFDITDNFVTVIKEDCSSMTINGGSITLSNGSIEFCPGDTTGTLSGLDFIFDVLLSGATADTSRWLLTDDQGVIVSIDDQDPPLSYGLMPLGTYNLYHIVYDDSTIEGLTIGANISGITGDYGLSNIIVLNSEPCVEECLVDGGMVSGDNNATSFEFCVGDGEIDSINLSTTSADTLYQFVITDTTGLVLDLPSGSIVDFENTPAGTCYIYGLAYEGS